MIIVLQCGNDIQVEFHISRKTKGRSKIISHGMKIKPTAFQRCPSSPAWAVAWAG